jgi:hypothetical protein
MKGSEVCKIAKNAFGMHLYTIPLSSFKTLPSTNWHIVHYWVIQIVKIIHISSRPFHIRTVIEVYAVK